MSKRILDGSEMRIEFGPRKREGGEERRVRMKVIVGLLEALFFGVDEFKSGGDCLQSGHCTDF